MLSIRLSRVGRKKAPTFRVVVMPKHRDPYAKVTEILGSYNPRAKQLDLKGDRVKHWLEQGAQPTDSVWNLLVENKLVDGKKRGVTTISKKRKGKMDEKAAEQKAKEEEAKAKAEEEAKAKAEAEAAEKEAEAPADEPAAEEKPQEEAPAEETPAPEEKKDEPAAEEKPAEEETKEEEKSE